MKNDIYYSFAALILFFLLLFRRLLNVFIESSAFTTAVNYISSTPFHDYSLPISSFRARQSINRCISSLLMSWPVLISFS